MLIGMLYHRFLTVDIQLNGVFTKVDSCVRMLMNLAMNALSLAMMVKDVKDIGQFLVLKSDRIRKVKFKRFLD